MHIIVYNMILENGLLTFTSSEQEVIEYLYYRRKSYNVIKNREKERKIEREREGEREREREGEKLGRDIRKHRERMRERY